MNWITVIWSMNVGACLTLAAFYGAVWCKQRENSVYLLFSCSAVAAAIISAFELWMLNATTVEQYQLLMRWIHVPVWVLTLSFVAFVRLYLHAGRAWLAWSIYSLRTLVFIINFIFPVSINFRDITDIRHFSWGGQMLSVPVGIPNPWGLLSEISLLLLLIFCIDATITVWRRGDRRRALLIGGSMIFGAILAWHVPLVIWGIIDVPFFLGFTYAAIVAAMGYELSRDMARAARLTRELEISEKRFNLAADSANLGMWEWDLEKDEIWVTPTRRAQLGFPASGRITFEDLISRWHADDRDKVREAVNDAIQNGKDYQADFRVVLADGSVQWLSARGRVQVDAHGKPKRLTGISLDITARKEAEVLARQQRGELEKLRQQKTALLEREVAERARLEREVIETHLVEELQSQLNLFENFVRNRGFRGGELKRLKERPRFLHRHLTNFGDRPARDFHRASFGAQSRPTAIRAERVTAIAAQKNAHVQFIFLALEPAEKSLHARKIRFAIAFDDCIALRGAQLAEGRVERNALVASVRTHIHRQLPVTRLRPRFDRAIRQRFALVRHYAIEIEINCVAEALAARTGSVRVVEGE